MSGRLTISLALVFVVVMGVTLIAAQTSGQLATISGTVVDDQEPAKPLSRAIVTVSGAGLTPSRSVITDDAGRFQFDQIAAGRYSLKAEKPAYVTSAYGSKRPARAGTPLVITAGRDAAGVTVKLWRGATIAGTIRDRDGRPQRNVSVRAVRDGGAVAPGLPTLTNNGTTTNDRGEYRIFGLEPGDYVVSAAPQADVSYAREVLTDAMVDALFAQLRQGRRTAAPVTTNAPELRPGSYSPVFYPGTANLSQATVLTLAPGQETTGVDVRLERIPVTTISGFVRTSDGSPAAGATVNLYNQTRPTRFATIRSSNFSGTTGPDGSFRITGVVPSSYRLMARHRPPGAPVSTPQGTLTAQNWASMELSVAGNDVVGVTMTLAPGIKVTGDVVFDKAEGSTAVIPDVSKVIIGIRSLVTPQFSQTAPRPDGAFTIEGGLPDSYVFSVAPAGVDPAWVVKSAISEGRDLLDRPMEFGARTSVTVTFTNRRSELAGRLQNSTGTPVTDLFVIAFITDRSYWGLENRRVQAVRPGVDGAFTFKDLPAGEYFLGALTDVDQGDWLRAGFLDGIVSSSVKVRIIEGQKTVQDLQIGR